MSAPAFNGSGRNVVRLRIRKNNECSPRYIVPAVCLMRSSSAEDCIICDITDESIFPFACK